MDTAHSEQEMAEVSHSEMAQTQVVMMNQWLHFTSPVTGTTSDASYQTPPLYSYSDAVGLRVPWQPFPCPPEFTHNTIVPLSGNLFPSEDGDLFCQQNDLLVSAPCGQQTTDESLYPGQFTPPPLPSPSSINWTLPYGPNEDALSHMSMPSDKMIGTLPYATGWEPQVPQATTSRSGIRVKFMGPEEIGLNHRQRSVTKRQLPSPGLIPEINYARLGDDVVEVEVSTSASHGPSSERVTFNSIEEALETIETQTIERDNPPTTQLHQPPLKLEADRVLKTTARPRTPVLNVADEKQEEVIKAAKSLFSKRTRTLYHWLYPDTSKTKLKATVSAAWDTLAEAEKQFYLSQVLGRFGLQASSLMINPQLDGIKGLPAAPNFTTGLVSKPSLGGSDPMHLRHNQCHHHQHVSEAQQAVDQLFASCEDSETWTSFDINPPCPSSCPCTLSESSLASVAHASCASTSRLPRARSLFGHSERKKRTKPGLTQLGMLAPDQLDEEVNILKRMREARLEAELEDDTELSSEVDKNRLMTQRSDRSIVCKDGDDFWRRTPDPEDIFTQLSF